MRCKFPPRDLGQRLDATVCRYRGDPVFVRVNGPVINLYKLTDMERAIGTINPNDADFDIATPPLGYVNFHGIAYYVYRRPVRKYKQGIDERSLGVETLRKDIRREHSPGNILYSKGFEQMMRGEYPSLDQGFSILRKNLADKEYQEIAIDRNIALNINKIGIVNVFYKNELVGWIQPDDTVVQVPQNGMGWVVSRYLQGLSWEVK